MITTLPDKEIFRYTDCEIAGDACWLIQPHKMGVTWTDENARFRSVIIRQSDNHVISQGFKKFVNFNETPDFQQWNPVWQVKAYHKLDGSLLLISKHRGELVIRTRGTHSYTKMDNASEMSFLKDKYPLAFDGNADLDDKKYTFLYEWTSPKNIIILPEHDQPTLTLLGIIENTSGKYLSQTHVDRIAFLYNLTRPEQTIFDSLNDCFSTVHPWIGKEGVVIYSPDSQTLKKIKSIDYCNKHRLSSSLTGISGVLESYMSTPTLFLSSQEFFDYIQETSDFEIADRCRDHIENIITAYFLVSTDIKRAQDFVDKFILNEMTMSESASLIKSNLAGNSQSYAFSYIHGKQIEKLMIKKAIKGYLKD